MRGCTPHAQTGLLGLSFAVSSDKTRKKKKKYGQIYMHTESIYVMFAHRREMTQSLQSLLDQQVSHLSACEFFVDSKTLVFFNHSPD